MGKKLPTSAPRSGPQALTTPKATPTYSFPSKSRCPRCSGVNTVVRTTNGAVRYMTCRAPVCRQEYKIVGQVI